MRAEEEERRRVLEEVFGSSSSDGDDVGIDFHPQEMEMHRWERVVEIDGLWLCREFLTPEQQSWLLSSIEREGWFTETSHNQAMRFGDLPEWAHLLSRLIYGSCFSEIANSSHELEVGDHGTGNIYPFPMDLLSREPLFDQLIANAYEPGEGICAHVDLMRFEDGESRYFWKHEINRKPGFQVWEGKEIKQQRRTSVTLRKLCPSA